MKNESLIKMYLASNALLSISQDIDSYDPHIASILTSCARKLAEDLKLKIDKSEEKKKVDEMHECQCKKEEKKTEIEIPISQDNDGPAKKSKLDTTKESREPSDNCTSHCMCHSQSPEPKDYPQRKELGPPKIDASSVDEKIKNIVSEIKSELNL